jgi:hypothetical protein
MQSHELAIMQIGRYLCDNTNRGIIYKVDRSMGLEVYADADFAGGWSAADWDNADNVLSQTGFVICYANCPVIWCSKLQTEIALFTTEAEYIAMSHALGETIPIQNLIKEIQSIFALPNPMTDFCITLHEDNLSAIAMAESWSLPLAQSILPSTIITFTAELIHLSTDQVTSRLSTSQPRNKLLIYSLSHLTVITSLHYARCYVDGDN